MSDWEVNVLSTWTAAGGKPRARVYLAKADGTALRFALGEEGGATFVFDAATSWALARPQQIVRVDLERPSGPAFFEYRLTGRSRRTIGPDGTMFTATGQPRLHDLSRSGTIRETIAGRTVERFDFYGTIPEYWARFVAPYLARYRLTGVALGTVPFTQKISLAWNQWTVQQLLLALRDAVKGEIAWRRLGDDSEVIDFLPFVGADVPVLPLRYGDLLQDHQLTEDTTRLFTATRVRGEAATADSERATIGENLWRIASTRAESGGRVALELREIGGTGTPILEDDQFAAHPAIDLPARYLQRADGTTRLRILGSLAASGDVLVSDTPSTSLPVVGERVSLVANVDGEPLEVLELPSAITDYGYELGDTAVQGGRGERQYAANGGHESGMAGWFPVNAGVGVEIPRSAFGVTETLQANGARAAAVGTGTPFLVKGLTPTVGAVYQGDELRTGGGTCAVQADAVADATGTLALTLDPGLPVALANNDPVTLVRRETRVLELAADHSRLMPIVRFTDDNTAGLPRTVSVGAVLQGDGRTYTVRSGRYASDPVADPPLVPLLAGPWHADLSVASVPGQIAITTEVVGDTFPLMPTGPAPVGTDGVSFYLLSAEIVSYGVTVGTRIAVQGSTIVSGFGAFLHFPYRVTSVVGLQVTAVADVTSLPPGTTAVFGHMTVGPSVQMLGSNVMIPAATPFTLTHTRETRTLQADGAHAAAATTLNTKAVAALARRDLVNGDTVSFRRPVTAGFTITAIVEHGDGTATATVDSGSNTLDALDPEEWNWILDMSRPFFRAAFLLTGGSATVAWYATAVASGTIELARLDGLAEYAGVGPETVESTWFVTDTYTNTVGDAFGNDAQATVTAAIPAGRTYPAGTRCWTNFHGSGAAGAQHDQATELRVPADVVGPASSFAIYATDGYTSLWNGSATPPTPCYRVMGSSADDASTLPIPGNVLYAAATAIANGAGEAAVTLVAANPNAIANLTPVTITRPALIGPTDRQPGSALRLFSGPGLSGEPSPTTPGYGHELAQVFVPEGSTRSMLLQSAFSLSRHDWFRGEGPACAIVDVAGTVLGWASLGVDGLLVEDERGEVLLTARATLPGAGVYGLRIYGGNATELARWCVHRESMFTLTEATAAPYTAGSFASDMLLVAGRPLVESSTPRITDRLTITELQQAYARALGIDPSMVPGVAIGGRVHIEDWDRLVRVVDFTITPTQDIADVEIGALAHDGARLLGDAALTAGVQEIR